MKCNVGGIDRIARLFLGVVLIALALLIPMSLTVQVVVLIIAAVALVTAAVRFCPANALLGLNSCPMADKESSKPQE